MGSLSNFGKELKEQFTTWYNHRNNRRGTLWAEGFRSVLVEDSHAALLTIATYIDLNPVFLILVNNLGLVVIFYGRGGWAG